MAHDVASNDAGNRNPRHPRHEEARLTQSSTRRVARRTTRNERTRAYAFMSSAYSKRAAEEGVFLLRRLSAYATLENAVLRDARDGVVCSEALDFNYEDLTQTARDALAAHNFIQPDAATDPATIRGEIRDVAFALQPMALPCAPAGPGAIAIWLPSTMGWCASTTCAPLARRSPTPIRKFWAQGAQAPFDMARTGSRPSTETPTPTRS